MKRKWEPYFVPIYPGDVWVSIRDIQPAGENGGQSAIALGEYGESIIYRSNDDDDIFWYDRPPPGVEPRDGDEEMDDEMLVDEYERQSFDS